jgi:hypothetical protein
VGWDQRIEQGVRFHAAVVGFSSDNLVSFVAAFPDQGSLTAWVGHALGAGEESTLELQWQMTVALPGNDAH